MANADSEARVPSDRIKPAGSATSATPATTAATGADGGKAEGQRAKRTITEIRDSKKTGEKMVYMSVPDYTSAKWAELAGVDVAVVGDSLAMVAHGHASTIPATMDMMIMHAQAVRRGAPNTLRSVACLIRAITRWSGR
jgi:hypothetical protein